MAVYKNSFPNALQSLRSVHRNQVRIHQYEIKMRRYQTCPDKNDPLWFVRSVTQAFNIHQIKICQYQTDAGT